MKSHKNISIPGSENLPISLDVFISNESLPQPVIIYAHGFNGFKDWGNTDLIAEKFAEKGFVFIKFNFSHNGTSPDDPENFTDLESFGRNNYSIELSDLKAVTDWVLDPENPWNKCIDSERVGLIGHSRGGGIAILAAAADKRFKQLVTWASVSECKTPWGNWGNGKMEEWKQSGVAYYLNSRTRQDMPLYYQLHEDFIENQNRLDIQNAIKALQIPVLVCHGTRDNSVPIDNAYRLKEWQPNLILFTVESDHVFGRSHPWLEENLPQPMQAVVDQSLLFFKQLVGQ